MTGPNGFQSPDLSTTKMEPTAPPPGVSIPTEAQFAAMQNDPAAMQAFLQSAGLNEMANQRPGLDNIQQSAPAPQIDPAEIARQFAALTGSAPPAQQPQAPAATPAPAPTPDPVQAQMLSALQALHAQQAQTAELNARLLEQQTAPRQMTKAEEDAQLRAELQAQGLPLEPAVIASYKMYREVMAERSERARWQQAQEQRWNDLQAQAQGVALTQSVQAQIAAQTQVYGDKLPLGAKEGIFSHAHLLSQTGLTPEQAVKTALASYTPLLPAAPAAPATAPAAPAGVSIEAMQAMLATAMSGNTAGRAPQGRTPSLEDIESLMFQGMAQSKVRG